MANDRRPTTNDPLLYYITDRKAFAPDETTRRRRLLDKINEAAHAGVDYIQIREKDLSTRELESLARDAVSVLRGSKTALLVNSRTDVALAAGANGVHLRSQDITPREVTEIWQKCGPRAPARISPRDPLIALSCHSRAELVQAVTEATTFAVFAPIFEKKDVPATKPAGLAKLHEACKSDTLVLALGGVTLENARSCLDAGASGIAAIRLFQENNIAEIAAKLRNL